MKNRKLAATPKGATTDGKATRIQFGALPYRIADGGGLQILLITSRTTRRWIVPKGWPIKGMKPAKAAAREAFEEAGVTGTVSAKPLGTFVYDKTLDEEGEVVPCEVTVFPLLVDRQARAWPEQHQRETRWFDLADVYGVIGEQGLFRIIADFAVKRGATRS